MYVLLATSYEKESTTTKTVQLHDRPFSLYHHIIYLQRELDNLYEIYIRNIISINTLLRFTYEMFIFVTYSCVQQSCKMKVVVDKLWENKHNFQKLKTKHISKQPK